jgi:hypothetical protein
MKSWSRGKLFGLINPPRTGLLFNLMRQKLFNGRSTVFLSRATSETDLPARESVSSRQGEDFSALRRDSVLFGGILLPRFFTMFVTKEYGSQDWSPIGEAVQGETAIGPRPLRNTVH